VELINELDKGSGVSINQLKEHAKIPEIEFQNAIMELINEGAIYQPSPHKYRKL
jgi:arginine deiminase